MRATGLLLKAVTPVFMLSTIVYGLLLNSIQLLCSIFLIPISRVLYLRVTAPLYKLLAFMFVWFLEWGGLCTIRVHSATPVAELLKNHSTITTYNHVGSIDWLVVSWVTDRFGKLGFLRCLAKRSLIVVPILGWSMWFCDFIFLKRNMSKDKRALADGMKHVRKAHRGDSFGKVPFQLVLFPEGTRSTTDKMKESQEWQRSQGMVPMKHVMYPRTKGFIQLWDGLGDNVDKFLDITLGYPEGCPSLPALLRGVAKPWEIHVLVTLKPREEIKEAEAKDNLKGFLVDVFRKKDEALSYYRKHGTFEEPELFPNEGRLVKNNVLPWTVVVAVQASIIYSLCTFPLTLTPLYSLLGLYAIVTLVYIFLM